jgi:SAM-dependent methyltransferase
MPPTLNPNHRLWNRYRDFDTHRGQLVSSVLGMHINLAKSRILDCGCGYGGIAMELARQGARVDALDPDPKKTPTLHSLRSSRPEINILCCPIDAIADRNAIYDAIVLVDTLEHMRKPESVLLHLSRILKSNGILYISTPSKWSPVNIICDPHYSLPGLAALSRDKVGWLIGSVLRWQPSDRTDFPQLLSFHNLDTLLCHQGWTWSFVNTAIWNYAWKHPKSIWNRQSHLTIIQWMKKLDLKTIIDILVTDKKGWVNRWLMPSWYIIARSLHSGNLPNSNR